MKRVLIVFICCCCFLFNSHYTQANELKFSGLLDVSSYWIDTSFTRPASKTPFGANQRLYLQATYNVQDYIKSVVLFEINSDWGVASLPSESSFGGSLGTDGLSVCVNTAYIDWLVPKTNIQMRLGLQTFVFPGFVADSAILDAQAAGITVHTSICDSLGITTWWIRPYSQDKPKTIMDTVGISLPISYDSFAITPWGVYGRIGKKVFNMQSQFGQPNQLLFPFIWEPYGQQNLTNNANIWWLGLTGLHKLFSSFSVAWDFNYGSQTSDTKKFNRSGWYAALLAQYQFVYVTPGILAWYTSGDSSSLKNGSKRMPTYDSNWTGTSMGFDGYWQERGTGASVAGNDPTGTWGLAAQLMGLSFIEKLKHNLRLAWYQGTNNKAMAKDYALFASNPRYNLSRNGFLTPNGLYLTTKDSVIELNVNSFYKIYENLMVGLELGWMHLKLDKDLWKSQNTKSNAYRFICTLRYTF